MSQTTPFEIRSNSPDEVLFLIYSLISSPICMHTKDWICHMYLRARSWFVVELGVATSHFEDGRLFIKYRNRTEPVPLNLTELLSHILDLDKPYSQIFCAEQVQVWKLTTKPSPLPFLCHDINKHKPLFNPAVFLALWGTYTIADFVNGRSLTDFIERHWSTVVSQCDRASLNRYWQQGCHPDGCNRCRCPGHELASILAPKRLPTIGPPQFGSLSNNEAEAVMMEIMYHIDPWIIELVDIELPRTGGLRGLFSGNCDHEWYRPNSSTGRWTQVSYFKPLAAIADGLVDTIERLKSCPDVIAMAKTRLAEELESLTSKIETQQREKRWYGYET